MAPSTRPAPSTPEGPSPRHAGGGGVEAQAGPGRHQAGRSVEAHRPAVSVGNTLVAHYYSLSVGCTLYLAASQSIQVAGGGGGGGGGAGQISLHSTCRHYCTIIIITILTRGSSETQHSHEAERQLSPFQVELLSGEGHHRKAIQANFASKSRREEMTL